MEANTITTMGIISNGVYDAKYFTDDAVVKGLKIEGTTYKVIDSTGYNSITGDASLSGMQALLLESGGEYVIAFRGTEWYSISDWITNFQIGVDNYDVSIYDFRSNTSFTDTFELLAMQFVDDGFYGEIPKRLEFYLDYEKMARDLRMDYCEFESNIITRVF